MNRAFSFSINVLLVCLLMVFCFNEVKAGRPGRKFEKKAQDLNLIARYPAEYINQTVFFYCRFATTSDLFKVVNTSFNSEDHINFSVWPDKVNLWTQKDRTSILPTLYLNKFDHENLEILRKLKRYELVAITGRVMNKFSNYPWILVTGIEQVERPSDVLKDVVVQHMQNGVEYLSLSNGGGAARHFETALDLGLPMEYHADIYEKLAKSYILDDRLDKAIFYLRQATESNPESAVLKLALADVALRIGDYTEALANCQMSLELSGLKPQVYGIMAEALAMSGKFVDAFNTISIAASSPGITDRENAILNIRRARIYTIQGNFIEAAKRYADAINESSTLKNESWVYKEIGVFYEANYLESGDINSLQSAAYAYMKTIELTPNDYVSWYRYAELEYKLTRSKGSQDFSKVEEILNSLNIIRPEYVPAKILQGRILFTLGRDEEANRIYSSIADQISSDPESLLALADAYVEQGNIAAAKDMADRAYHLQTWNQRARIISSLLNNDKVVRDVAERVEASSGVIINVLPEESRETSGRIIQIQPGDIIKATPGTTVNIEPSNFSSPSSYEQSTYAPVSEYSYVSYIPGVHEEQLVVESTSTSPITPLNLGYNVTKSPAAYAAMSEVYNDQQLAREEMIHDKRTASTFSFQADPSEVLIENYLSPYGYEQAVNLQNSNLQAYNFKRPRPAEILEFEITEDISTMSPPGDGKIERAEVIMPTQPHYNSSWPNQFGGLGD